MVAGSRLELAAELPIAAGSWWQRWSPRAPQLAALAIAELVVFAVVADS